MASNASSVRKAAILISALDSETADKLLEQMPPELASRVRAMAAAMDDVRPEIQRQVLDEFFSAAPIAAKRVSRPAISLETISPEGDVELQLSGSSARAEESPVARSTFDQSTSTPMALAAEPSDRSQTDSLRPTQDAPDFRFLDSIAVETLAAYLQREHVATVAAVLDQLPPERSAAVLAKFDPRSQRDIVRRLADSEPIDVDALREIAATLGASLGPQVRGDAGKKRLASARSICDALDPASRTALLASVGDADYDLANALGMRPVLSADQGVCPHAPSPEETTSTRTGASRRARDARATFVFEALADLSDGALAAVLREAAPATVAIALADASPRLIERLRRFLPAKSWRDLEARLRGMGPYRLSDVETAQRELAEIADRLARPAAVRRRETSEFAA